MNDRNSKYLRNAVLALVGAVLGSLVGLVAEFLLFRSGYIGWLLNLIPPEQAPVRLLIGLLLSYFTIAVGAGVGGALTGYFIWRVDSLGSRARYLWGGAWAFAVGQGILLIPMLLFFVFSAMYQNGVLGEQVKYGIMFAFFGVIYGLLVGLVLAVATVRLRYGWAVFLATLLGFAIGAGLIGYSLSFVNGVRVGHNSAGTSILRLLLFSLVFTGFAGATLGLAYTWIAGKREQGKEPTASSLQTWILVVVSALVLLLLAGFTGDIVNFITVRPGTTSTQLSLSTQGVQWNVPFSVAEGVPAAGNDEPGLAVNTSGVAATTWTQANGSGSDVMLAFVDPAAGASKVILPVSQNPEAQAVRPQVVVDDAGRAHVVWQEADAGATSIRYSRCEGDACSEPVTIADASGLACAASTSRPGALALAGSDNDTVLLVWYAGAGLAYATWPVTAEPPAQADGCVPGADAFQADEQFSVAGGKEDGFALSYATSQGDVWVQTYGSGAWQAAPTVAGQGASPDVFISRTGEIYSAWCSLERRVQFQTLGGPTETIEFPGCVARPELAEDALGQPHLIWYAEELKTIFDDIHPGSMVYESVRLDDGWTEPAIVTTAARPQQPVVATQANGALHAAWQASTDAGDALFYAMQEPYSCSDSELTRMDSIVLDAIRSGGFHPADFQTPYCRNRYLSLVYTPNIDPKVVPQPPTPNGGFDRVSTYTSTTRYEVLFTTMMWDPADENYLNPGSVFANEVAALYNQIKADPQKYPKGLTVRILLGNYPNVSQFTWGDQIWSVLDELRHAGVAEMENPEIGWKLEVANYPGVMPHSHTKFVVIDGATTIGAGFNYGYLHLPREHPSGKGDNLVDLAMVISGPMSQMALATYDDIWEGANQIYCADFHPADGSDWKDTCEQRSATVSHVPEVLKYHLAAADSHAYSLFRSGVYKEADYVVQTAMASAAESIDILHVNFAGDLICGASVINPDLCDYENNALPWMRALVEAIETNGVHVRVMSENSNMNGLENRVGMKILLEELERRGLSDHVELRFYNGRVHAKSMLIDDELLIVGSQNLHYSSWGEGGLLEYDLATTDPEAVRQYQALYEEAWQRATPAEETDWESAPS